MDDGQLREKEKLIVAEFLATLEVQFAVCCGEASVELDQTTPRVCVCAYSAWLGPV